ncbi:hypothetical protein StoSoilB13_19480 [Arthrobacter sp. StoSoilB13]|nr:hypothetical protein StoSoilB13_19480 [Arthrobacter sp. StoSoilB13]
MEVANPTPWIMLIIVILAGTFFLRRRHRRPAKGTKMSLALAARVAEWLGLSASPSDLKSRTVSALMGTIGESFYEGAPLTCADQVHIRCEGEQYFQLRQQLAHFASVVIKEANEQGSAYGRRSGGVWTGCPQLSFHLHRGPMAVFATRDPDAVPVFEAIDDAVGNITPTPQSGPSLIEHSPKEVRQFSAQEAIPSTEPAAFIPPTEGVAPRYSVHLSVDDAVISSVDVPARTAPVGIKVGRGPECELKVPAESSRVSRIHMDMTFAEKGIYVADKSTWGTWHGVNGNWQRLDKGKPTFVAVGDSLALTGDLAIQVRVLDVLDQDRS